MCLGVGEKQKKSRHKTHLRFGQPDKCFFFFFPITKSPYAEQKSLSGDKDERGIEQFEFKVYKEQQMAFFEHVGSLG